MRILLLLAALSLAAGTAGSQSFSGSAKATTAASFLELGVGGRAMGLGGAYTAVADDASALYWNPAGLTNVERRSATFMHAAYLQSSFYDYAAYAQNLGPAGAFGASFQYLSAGSIQETDANFNQTGTFTPNDLAVAGGYAYKLQGGALAGAALGADVKYIHSTILNSAQTAAVDAGALSPELLDRRLRFGLAMTNLGGTLKYAQTAENLPLTFKAGAALRPTQRWLTSLDVGVPRDNAAYVAVGTEYQLVVSGGWGLAGRLGYSSQSVSDASGVTGVSVGVGIASQAFGFDYAFVPYGSLGVTNRFSVSAKF